jgi:hypothetical protein
VGRIPFDINFLKPYFAMLFNERMNGNVLVSLYMDELDYMPEINFDKKIIKVFLSDFPCAGNSINRFMKDSLFGELGVLISEIDSRRLRKKLKKLKNNYSDTRFIKKEIYYNTVNY